MRIIILFIGLLFIIHPLSGQADSNNILNKKIKLSLQGITIQQIITEVSSTGGVVFSFEPSEIPLQTEIHFSLLEISLKDILKEIETITGVTYTLRSNVIILKKPIKGKQPGTIRKTNFTISGTLIDSISGETLPYATVGVEGQNVGTLTNSYGFYSLTLPENHYKLICRFVGYQEKQFSIDLDRNIQWNTELSTVSQQIGEVVVTREKDNLKNIERRLSPVEIKTIQTIPSLFSEADVLRNILLLPGINSVAEVGGTVIVRGGGSDQNLMMIDEATVYNPSHMLGTFSIFNPEIIKDIKFYKSGIPLAYGGRISSVMDVTQKDGNMKSFHGSAGIGLIASNLEIEGPVIKDRASFIVAARRSYIDMFFKYIPNDNIQDVHTYFYDLNAKFNFIINNKNRLFLSCYLGNDLNDFSSEDQEYGNITTTLRYNHIFSHKLFSNTSIIYSRYIMKINDPSGDWGWKNKMGLNHYELKSSFNYYTSKHTFEFGLRGVYYQFFPGDQQPTNDSSLTLNIKLPTEYAFESALYLSDNFKIGSRMELNYGLRYSMYNFLGPADIYQYDPGLARDPSSITGITHYTRNEVIQTYSNFEPRVSFRFDIARNHTIKLSYNKMAQYVQQVSNTVFTMPFNTWKPSNAYINPLTGNQYALGYFTDMKKSTIDLSVELYYKQLKNVLEVQPGTDIWLNNTLDAGLLQGEGRAYGFEIMANKPEGRLTGMISYSWSQSERKVDSKYPLERINFGNYYPADYDIPHKFTFSGEYRVSPRFSFTCGFMYQTGRPISFPDGQYTFMGSYIPYYSGKNLDRMPDFHRLDVGAIVKGKKKPWRKYSGTWTFSIYNLYARKNPYSIYIRRISGSKNTEAIQFWAMGIVPSIAYSIKF
jgi:hypothetical protein